MRTNRLWRLVVCSVRGGGVLGNRFITPSNQVRRVTGINFAKTDTACAQPGRRDDILVPLRRHATRGFQKNQRSAKRSRHPSALAPHSVVFPRPHRYADEHSFRKMAKGRPPKKTCSQTLLAR